MAIFGHNYTLGFIKEVGEEDILITIDGVDVEVALSDSNRQPILDAVSRGDFMIPVDSQTNELLMNVDDETLREIFPETDLPELMDATEFEEEE